MPSTLKFDEARLLETAHAVQIVNPYARNYPVDALVENMKATARRAFDDGSHGYVSTLGFVLSLFTNDDGSREIHSSVATYSVIGYAKAAHEHRCPVCQCAPDDHPCECCCHSGIRIGIDEKGRKYDTKTGEVL